MTVPVWLYLLVLSPWLQPGDGGKLIQIEREKGKFAMQVYAEPSVNKGWRLFHLTKNEVNQLAEITMEGPAKALFEPTVPLMRSRKIPMDLSKWFKGKVGKRLSRAKTLQLRDGGSLKVSRSRGKIRVTDPKGDAYILSASGAPTRYGQRFTGAAQILKPAIKVSASKKLKVRDGPEAVAASLLRKLLRKDKSWQSLLLPRMGPKLRATLSEGLPKMAAKLKSVTLVGRLYRAQSDLLKDSKSIETAELTLVGFGSYDVLVTAQDDKGKLIFIGLKRHRGSWAVTGALDERGDDLKPLTNRLRAHRAPAQPKPALKPADADGWRRLVKPMVLAAVKDADWTPLAGDPLSIAGAYLRSLMSRGRQLELCMHPALRHPMVLRRLAQRGFEGATILGIQQAPTKLLEKLRTSLNLTPEYPTKGFQTVLAEVTQKGQKRLLRVTVLRTRTAWRVVEASTYRPAGNAGAAKGSSAAHPAVAVAEAVLRAIAAQDAAGVRKHLNKVNRRKVKPSNIDGLLKYAAKQTAGVTQVTEIREGPKRGGPGAVIAKVRAEGDDVFVVVLTFEDGRYVFEDINSPSPKSYNSKKLLWRR